MRSATRAASTDRRLDGAYLNCRLKGKNQPGQDDGEKRQREDEGDPAGEI